MAVDYGKDTTLLWARLLDLHDLTYRRLRHTSGEDDRSALETRLYEYEEAILLARAPNIGAIHHKLELLWQGKLHGNDLGSQIRLNIFGEVRMEAWHTLSQGERMARAVGTILGGAEEDRDFHPGRDLLNPDWLDEDEPSRSDQTND